jgi:hypothetical protein
MKPYVLVCDRCRREQRDDVPQPGIGNWAELRGDHRLLMLRHWRDADGTPHRTADLCRDCVEALLTWWNAAKTRSEEMQQ